MNNTIPESRIRTQKLKVEVLREFTSISTITLVLNIILILVLLYNKHWDMTLLISSVLIYYNYRIRKAFKIFLEKETEVVYKMIKDNNYYNQ